MSKQEVHELRKIVRAKRGPGAFPRERLVAFLRARWEEGESVPRWADELGLSGSAVLDTSLLVAGWGSRSGASFEILRLVPHGLFDLVLSVPLVLEYEAVLLRHRSTGQTAKHVTDLVDYLCAQAHHQDIFYLWRPCLSDPGDDMVLELAVAAQADFVVTHNLKDFAGASQFRVTPIAPGAFLQILMKG